MTATTFQPLYVPMSWWTKAGAKETTATWRIFLVGTFSTLARLECLANCYDSATRRYHHVDLIAFIPDEDVDAALRIAHRLVWEEWMKGTLEQQHADLLLYLRNPAIRITERLASWRDINVLANWLPDSVDPLDEARFQSNLSVLLNVIRSEYDVALPSGSRSIGVLNDAAAINQALCVLKERYTSSDLTLATMARELHLSSGHLGRLFQRHVGKSFRQCLRAVRLAEAANKLLTEDTDIKAITAMIGYSSRRHFDADFRAKMGCTPAQFRRAKKAALMLEGVK
jgi:AraC-like DNA-binding protein